jgi:DNA-binding MarR family transcriptional regulator
MSESGFAVVQDAPMNILEIEACRLLDSPTFRRSPVLSRLLPYLVRMTTESRPVKAFEIAIDCFGRDGRESVESDGYARVTVTRLRKVLAEHYKNEASEHELEIKPGSYVVRLKSRCDPAMSEHERLVPFETDAARRGIFFPEERNVEPGKPDLATLAYLARRLRDAVFEDDDLFGEPAWDMLLSFSNASTSGKRVTVKEICKDSCTMPSTALRWLSIMEGKGLVERVADTVGQEACLRLSPKGLAKMENYLRALQQLVGPQPAPASQMIRDRVRWAE